MALTPDPRYDVLLVDSPDGVTANETLGLMLVENSGALSYSENMISPYAGQLASGDIQDRDLTRGTIRTQRDWRGGRGLLNAYTETNRYYDATADTRFINSVLLPPEAKAGISTGDPDFLPTKSGVSLAPFRLTGEFSKDGRVDGTKSATAGWLKGNRVDGLDYMRFVSIQRATTAYHTFGAELEIRPPNIAIFNRTRLAQSFTTTSAVSMTQIQLYLALIPLEFSSPPPPVIEYVNVRVKVYTDTSGAIGTWVAEGVLALAKPYTATMFQPYNPGWKTINISASLAAGKTYWMVVETDQPATTSTQNRMAWYIDPASTYTGQAKQAQTATSIWGIWSGLAPGHYFQVNPGGPSYLTDLREDRRLAQSFATTGAVSMTQVQIPIWYTRTTALGTVTVRLCANSGGAPGTVLATTTVTPGAVGSWTTATLSASLAASTTYWIELVGSGSVDATNFEVAWLKDANATYGSGEGKSKQDSAGYAAAACDFYFVVNTLASGAPKFYTHEVLTKQALAQRFTTVGAVTVNAVTLRIGKVAWQGSPTLTLTIRANGLGNPAGVLATKTLTDPGAMDWETVTLTSSLNLSAATDYWLMLEADAPAATDGISIEWQGDTAQNYGGLGKTYDYAAYVLAQMDFYFTLNGYSPGNVYFYNWKRLKNGYAQSFATGASGVSLSYVRLYAQLVSSAGNGNILVTIQANSGSAPSGTVLASKVLYRADFSTDNAVAQKNWVKATLNTTVALAATTTYWIVINSDAPVVGDAMIADIYGDANAGYAGTLIPRTNTDEWSTYTNGSAIASDIFFTANIGSGLAAAITANPQRFGNNWFVAAANIIYLYVPGSNTWNSVYTAAANITRLATFAGKLWAALGDATDMVNSVDGNAWVSVTGTWKSATNPGNFRYTFLKAYNGYLYALRYAGAAGTGGGGAHALAYSDGTNWYSVAVASSDIITRGLAGFQNEIMITSTTGLYSLSGDLVYQVLDWELEHAGDAGRNPTTWMADGRIYIPIRSGLNAFDGGRVQPVGLDLDEGLPKGEQGQVVALAGSKSFLFAAIDAVNDRSAIYAWNGQGWHCLAKATTSGRRIRALGMEAVTSSAANIRLWWFEEATPYYMEMPALSDNPRDYTGMRFALTGVVTSCAMGGELAQIPKDLQRVVVTTENCTANQTVAVYVDVDQANLWTLVGTVTQSPEQTLNISPANIAPLTVASGSTTNVIQVEPGTPTSSLQVGMFVRVGDTDIGQILTVDSDRQFTLVSALRNGAPVAGVRVFGATPAGYEFRYRLVLQTTDATKSPLVRRVSLKWQELLIDKGRFALAVRAEDNMDTRTGTPYQYGAAELRQKLQAMSRRLTPLYMVEPDGGVRRVKITSYNTSGFSREENNRVKTQRFKTRIDLQLDEA